jgi:ribosomal protein S19E (S16A)
MNQYWAEISLIDGGVGAIPRGVGTGEGIQEETLREIVTNTGIFEDTKGRGRGDSEKGRRDCESIPEEIRREKRDLTEQG